MGVTPAKPPAGGVDRFGLLNTGRTGYATQPARGVGRRSIEAQMNVFLLKTCGGLAPFGSFRVCYDDRCSTLFLFDSNRCGFAAESPLHPAQYLPHSFLLLTRVRRFPPLSLPGKSPQPGLMPCVDWLTKSPRLWEQPGAFHWM